jgi:two-component sensor histidine kinase
MAVHRRLDPVRNTARIDVAPLIREVAEEAVLAARREDLTLEFDLPPLALPTRQAAPLALIVGELVRNAVRHAFPERGGRVRVRIARPDAAVELSVADNGVGCAAEPAGFGATLVGLLTQQLRGQAEWRDAGPGVCGVVRFPAPV